jgi:hypothetical protein
MTQRRKEIKVTFPITVFAEPVSTSHAENNPTNFSKKICGNIMKEFFNFFNHSPNLLLRPAI